MPPASNWRSPADYAYLNELTPACLAWEFSRRNPRYIKDYQNALRQSGNEAPAEAIARRWGLPFPVDPVLGADRAPVVWRPHLDPMSVLLSRAPANFRARSVRMIANFTARRVMDNIGSLAKCALASRLSLLKAQPPPVAQRLSFRSMLILQDVPRQCCA